MGKVKIIPEYEHANVNIIPDIKLYWKFIRRERFVTNGHPTAPPPSITYSTVVSRDNDRIVFLLSSLNVLVIFACDIGNEYLNDKRREKICNKMGDSVWNKSSI